MCNVQMEWNNIDFKLCRRMKCISVAFNFIKSDQQYNHNARHQIAAIPASIWSNGWHWRIYTNYPSFTLGQWRARWQLIQYEQQNRHMCLSRKYQQNSYIKCTYLWAHHLYCKYANKYDFGMKDGEVYERKYQSQKINVDKPFIHKYERD